MRTRITGHGKEIKAMKRIIVLLSTLTALMMLAGCAATQKAEVKQTELNCGLLGADCAKLTAGGKDEASWRFINVSAPWSSYNKVMIAPVSIYGGDKIEVPAEDQKKLVDYFYQQLIAKMQQKFEIVGEPGPGVMKVQVAMTDASAATPVMRTVSMIPGLHLISSLMNMTTGTYPFVGGAQAEAKVTDSQTGVVLAEVVDAQIGGGAYRTGLQWKYGDAENAIKHWCEVMTQRLSDWTHLKKMVQ